MSYSMVLLRWHRLSNAYLDMLNVETVQMQVQIGTGSAACHA